MRNSKRYAGIVALVLLLATACNGGTDDPGAGATSTVPTSVDPPATTSPATTTSTVGTTSTTTTVVQAPVVVPILVWTDQPSAAVVTEAAAKFTADTGIPIDVAAMDLQSIRTEVETGSATPDIFLGEHTWADGLLAEGLISPTDMGTVDDAFLAFALDAFTRDSGLLAVPAGIEMPVLYRNTDLAPDLPSDAAAMLAACTAVEDEVSGCLGFPTDDPAAGYAFLMAFGGYAVGFDAGTQIDDVGFHKEEAIAGADWMDEQVTSGLIDPELVGVEAADLFREGQLPFLWVRPSDAGEMPESVPLAVSPFPPVDGEAPIPLIDVLGYFMSSTAAQPAPALTFLVEYLADPEPLLEWAAATGLAPVRLGALAELVDTNPTAQGFGLPLEAVPSFHLRPTGPHGESVLGVIEWAIEFVLQQSYDNAMPDSAAVLNEAADRVRQLAGTDV